LPKAFSRERSVAGSEAIQAVEKTRKNRLFRCLRLDCRVTSFLVKTEKERSLQKAFSRERSVAGSEAIHVIAVRVK